MADNVTIPAQGAGTTTPVVATDEVGGIHFQRVKIDLGATDATSPLVRGQQTKANSIPAVLASDSDALPVTLNVPTTILNGKTTVSTAGTRVALAGATACKSVTIKALATNTGLIYVGNNTVASTNGLQLAPGESVSLDIADLSTVNLDAANNNDGVTYLGVN